MIRTHLISLLEQYQPTESEMGYKKRMLAFIKTYPNCFERSLEIGHITASGWLLNQAGDKVLLLHHAKIDMWVQPGGHCDGDPDVAAVALKEAREESGIEDIALISPALFDIDIHHIPEYKGVPAHDHYDVRFLLQVNGSEKFVQNHESKALRWFSKDEALPTQEWSVMRMADKWKRL